MGPLQGPIIGTHVGLAVGGLGLVLGMIPRHWRMKVRLRGREGGVSLKTSSPTPDQRSRKAFNINEFDIVCVDVNKLPIFLYLIRDSISNNNNNKG